MASETATRISESTARAESAVSDLAERTTEGITRGIGGAGATAGDLARQARSQFSELFERHPLVLGGLGLALGAAIAYSFRPTETEGRWLGETSYGLKTRAREMAEEQFHRAQGVAERAYEAARDEAREQGMSPEGGREAAAEVGRKARAVADRAREAAREEWNVDTAV
jgi:GNAT superfamily N-acetyltransferase